MQIQTKINAKNETFLANYEYHKSLSNDLSDLQATVALGGNERSRNRHVSRGKLLPRDRVKQLLDPNSPFLEFSMLAAHGTYDDDVPAASMHHRDRERTRSAMRDCRK